MAPNFRPGKICYIEIPANDIAQSAEFYARAFEWRTRTRGDGAVAFDDTVGEVSGTWVTGRQPIGEDTLTVYIMAADAGYTAQAVVAAGGEIVRRSAPDFPEVYFLFRDPAGNVLGVYQQPGLARIEQAVEA